MLTIKEGDRLPVLTATLKDADGVAIPLGTATSVKFLMASKTTGTLKVDANATIVDAAAGQISYAWGANDTDTPGTYQCEFEILWNSGKKQTVPTVGYFDIMVEPDLG